MQQSLRKPIKMIQGLKDNIQTIRKFLLSEGFSRGEIELLMEFLVNQKILKKNIADVDSLNLLIKKGIIQDFGNDICVIKSFHEISTWIEKHTEEKVQSLRHHATNFVNILESTFEKPAHMKIKFYEGIDGIKDSYYHILDNAKDEICAYFSVMETEQPQLQMFFEKEYVPERSKRGIFARNIAPRTPKTIFYKLRSSDNLSVTRLISPEFFPILNAEVNLYEDFMHCMLFDEHGGMAIVIQAKQLVYLQKALFDISWRASKQFSFSKMADENKGEDREIVNNNNFYVTDNIRQIIERIDSRKDRFTPDLISKFPTAKATHETTKSGEQILKICGLEVMSDFQKPYMKKLAEIGTIHGGNILNVGYGLGLVDQYIQDKNSIRDIKEHHIIEINEDICKEAEKWRLEQKNPERIFIHQGDWKQVLLKFEKEGKIFDGVIYDGYPLEIDDICRDAIPFIYSLLGMKLLREKTGILTFFMDSTDGFGSQFQKYLYSLGVKDIQVKKVNIELPDRYHEHWENNFFLAPILTDINYS